MDSARTIDSRNIPAYPLRADIGILSNLLSLTDMQIKIHQWLRSATLAPTFLATMFHASAQMIWDHTKPKPPAQQYAFGEKIVKVGLFLYETGFFEETLSIFRLAWPLVKKFSTLQSKALIITIKTQMALQRDESAHCYWRASLSPLVANQEVHKRAHCLAIGGLVAIMMDYRQEATTCLQLSLDSDTDCISHTEQLLLKGKTLAATGQHKEAYYIIRAAVSAEASAGIIHKSIICH